VNVIPLMVTEPWAPCPGSTVIELAPAPVIVAEANEAFLHRQGARTSVTTALFTPAFWKLTVSKVTFC